LRHFELPLCAAALEVALAACLLQNLQTCDDSDKMQFSSLYFLLNLELLLATPACCCTSKQGDTIWDATAK